MAGSGDKKGNGKGRTAEMKREKERVVEPH